MGLTSKSFASFTLIEVLISIMVVSFSLTILFGIVITTLESKKAIEKGVDREVTTALVIRELKRELESLYFSGGKGGGLYVEELGYFGRPFDRLIFTTYYGGEHREIEYTFEPEEEGEGNTARMIKRVDRDLDGDIKTGGYPLEILSGVKMFDVRIFNNGSWHERWNLGDGIPDFIEITLAVSGVAGKKKLISGEESSEKVIRLFVEVGRKNLIGGKGRYILPPARK